MTVTRGTTRPVDTEHSGPTKHIGPTTPSQRRGVGRRWREIVVVVVAVVAPAAHTAMFGPARAAVRRSNERACVFTDVATDGVANNVRSYRNPRRSARDRQRAGPVVRRVPRSGNHIAGRQRTDRGRVRFANARPRINVEFPGVSGQARNPRLRNLAGRSKALSLVRSYRTSPSKVVAVPGSLANGWLVQRSLTLTPQASTNKADSL